VHTRAGRVIKPRIISEADYLYLAMFGTSGSLNSVPTSSDSLYSVPTPKSHTTPTVMRITEVEPKTYKHALKSHSWVEWSKAMAVEMEAFERLGVWEKVHPPKGANIISGKWVFKIKLLKDGSIARYKARFVCRGFEQQYGVDYVLTYAPVASHKSIRMILALGAQYSLKLKQIDFETAFLNAPLEEVIYVAQPPGYDDSTGMVCRLNRALYGLKQAPKVWNDTINSTMMELGYTRCTIDACVYFKHGTTQKANTTVNVLIIACLYVDDTIIAFNPESEFIWNIDKAKIAERFPIQDIGDVNWILNMEVARDWNTGTITLSQQGYINKMLKEFGLEQCKSVPTPMVKDNSGGIATTDSPLLKHDDHGQYRSLIGSLMYAANITRPDIAYATTALSRFLSAPTEFHMKLAKRVLRYLAGTKHYSLVFGTNNNSTQPLKVYTDADWATDRNKRRSTTGIVVLYNGNIVAWASKLQPSTAGSTAEAEYMALAAGMKEARWFRAWLKEVMSCGYNEIPLLNSKLNPAGTSPIVPLLMCDNQAAIAIANKGNAAAPTAKHISIRCNQVQEEVAHGLVLVQWCPTDQQLADILTKPIATQQHNVLLPMLLHIKIPAGTLSVSTGTSDVATKDVPGNAGTSIGTNGSSQTINLAVTTLGDSRRTVNTNNNNSSSTQDLNPISWYNNISVHNAAVQQQMREQAYIAMAQMQLTDEEDSQVVDEWYSYDRCSEASEPHWEL
jgi:hypothetical protein